MQNLQLASPPFKNGFASSKRINSNRRTTQEVNGLKQLMMIINQSSNWKNTDGNVMGASRSFAKKRPHDYLSPSIKLNLSYGASSLGMRYGNLGGNF